VKKTNKKKGGKNRKRKLGTAPQSSQLDRKSKKQVSGGKATVRKNLGKNIIPKPSQSNNKNHREREGERLRKAVEKRVEKGN